MRNRVVPTLLRLAVAVSNALFRGRGVGYACTVAGRLIASEGSVSFQLGGGGTFLAPVDDRYWLEPLLVERGYELDLDHFLRRMLTSSDIFFDCGANLGLWSVVAARVIPDPMRVVAVEASSRTFSRLLANWEANGRSFTLLHRALSDVTGNSVSFFASPSDPASATLVEKLSPKGAQPETVTTVSLLDLVRQWGTRKAQSALVFVKLDVEGMERQVLATIDPEQHTDLVILYEDHGSDTSHITAFLLERGLKIAFLSDDGTLEQIELTTLHRLDALKVSPARGYNLLAISPRGAAAGRLAEVYPQLEIRST